MIKEVEGDILLSKAEAIAHGVAPMDHFDSGLALSLRQDYPSLYKDFRHYCQTYHPKTGDVWLWQASDRKKIFNLLTQDPPPSDHSHPGRASLSAVRHCLRSLANQMIKENIQSLALPKLATGVGALDWDKVKPIILEQLGSLHIPVYVYAKFIKGQKAVE
ncbi:MAG: macro domain-containing protein [Saprospiraceae bacterium]|nr:macro domain-containing protein [Saprospiraceae bacterium]